MKITAATQKAEVLMDQILKDAINAFWVWGDFLEARPYGNGHINDTYLVRLNQAGNPVPYILQRINHHVFQDPVSLMDNIWRVTLRQREVLEEQGAEDISRRVLTCIPTREGLPYHLDEQGHYYRAYLFIDNARTHDILGAPRRGYEAARAFGRFQSQIAELQGPPLHQTIPHFHDGPSRLRAFLEALDRDNANRAARCRPEIEFIQEHSRDFEIFPELIQAGRLRVRTTHNDTKINNIMIDDRTGEGICVIDLDTVMPGLPHYDFGDLARTTLSDSAEDERDLAKVRLNMEYFEAILTGYLEAVGPLLNSDERNHLVFSTRFITLMIGTRFLTDHLEGDRYFKVHRENHNLDRCRTQIQLVREILRHEEAMQQKIEQCYLP